MDMSFCDFVAASRYVRQSFAMNFGHQRLKLSSSFVTDVFSLFLWNHHTWIAQHKKPTVRYILHEFVDSYFVFNICRFGVELLQSYFQFWCGSAPVFEPPQLCREAQTSVYSWHSWLEVANWWLSFLTALFLLQKRLVYNWAASDNHRMDSEPKRLYWTHSVEQFSFHRYLSTCAFGVQQARPGALTRRGRLHVFALRRSHPSLGLLSLALFHDRKRSVSMRDR